MPESAKPVPTLATLPSELRRLIVSHLAPSGPEDLRPGCKIHLKNANLAHRCLHEWVPEFMFRDMALDHVIVGMASFLERFAVNRANARLLEHVKAVQVKVPPAIRWEVGTNEPFDGIEDLTTKRLLSKHDVDTTDQLTNAQRQYCAHYHRALVEPFTNNRNWYNLLRYAQQSWGQVFRYFPNLQHIGVGCCERLDHPTGTYTEVFVSQFGRDVLDEAHPTFIEDRAVNIAWASAIVLENVPQQVRSLQLSMANIDNYNSFATVNRLMSIVYRNSQFLVLQPPLGITRLSITVRGLKGTHGDPHWTGDTGSAGLLRYWKKVLSSLSSLTYLAFDEDLDEPSLHGFTEGEETDEKDSVVTWLLHQLRHNKLETLRLSNIEYNCEWLRDMFFCHWPNFKTVIFDDVVLVEGEPQQDPMPGKSGEGTPEPDEAKLRPRKDTSWLRVCRSLFYEYPGLRIHLKGVRSCLYGEERDHLYAIPEEELRRMPGVTISGPFTGPKTSIAHGRNN